MRPATGAMHFIFALIFAGSCAAYVSAADHRSARRAVPANVMTPLSLRGAVIYALEHNRELAMLRQQRGIAQAGVVIARTYPFNPSWESRVAGANGPTSAGVTNHVLVESSIRLDVEVRGQSRLRREAACAALSRTEWEIAAQEFGLAIRVMRAYDTYLYRKAKLEVLDQNIVLQEKSTERVKLLTEQGKLRAADLLLARADVVEWRAARSEPGAPGGGLERSAVAAGQ